MGWKMKSACGRPTKGEDKHGCGNHSVGYIIPILSSRVLKMKIHQHVTRPSNPSIHP